MPADELNKVIQQSKIIISRSGYTTVMDLVVLRKKAILIPTPGQKKQEYLAEYLFQKQYFFSSQQKNFSIEDAIKKTDSFHFKSVDFNKDEYKKTIHEFALSLNRQFCNSIINLELTIESPPGAAWNKSFLAINYSAIKYFTANHYAGPFGINIIRIGISLILFWILFLFKRPEKKIDKKDIPAFLLCALTAIALNQMLFIKGLSFTFPIHAALLTLITPIFITILAARMLKEKITFTKTFGLLLGVVGAVLLISNRGIGAPGENALLGDFLVILSAFAYTFYFILVKPLMNKYSAIQVIRWIFTIGFLMTLPLSLKEFTDITWQVFALKDWLILFVIVVPEHFWRMFLMYMGYKN